MSDDAPYPKSLSIVELNQVGPSQKLRSGVDLTGADGDAVVVFLVLDALLVRGAHGQEAGCSEQRDYFSAFAHAI